MEHRSECEVSKVLLEQARSQEHFSDEKVFRRLATDLVNKMPFDDFRLLFNLEKVDEKSIEKFMKVRMPTETEMMLLDDLRARRVIKYTISIDSPDIIESRDGFRCPSCGKVNERGEELWRTESEFKEEPDPHYSWQEVNKCKNCKTIYKLNNGT